ncbi:MAG: hypothetical protein FJW36_04600 [Acidobacteria bacterium]|nr:hypothetical protein [Acidobacteriota bacterium]
MLKLNQADCTNDPDEFPNPTFTLLGNVSLNVTNLPGHMALAHCCNSAKLRLKGDAPGPTRELPSYNISSPFGPNAPNLLSDTCLITVLVKTIQSGLPNFFKNWSLGSSSVAGPGSVAKIIEAFTNAGWPCPPTETLIQPDQSASGSSLMPALNDFAFKANRPKYISLANAPSSVLGAPLAHDFQVSR